MPCVICDCNGKDAKRMGVERIVSQGSYGSLSAAEKSLWRSYVHEAKSGQRITPGIAQAAAQALMDKLAGTYGKAGHTDLNKTLPLGIPRRMTGFTDCAPLSPPHQPQAIQYGWLIARIDSLDFCKGT